MKKQPFSERDEPSRRQFLRLMAAGGAALLGVSMLATAQTQTAIGAPSGRAFFASVMVDIEPPQQHSFGRQAV